MLDDAELIKLIGKNIKKLRQVNALTQAQLGDMVYMEDSAIRRIESGKTNPTIKTLCKFCDAFNVSFHELIKQETE